jgi:hypothetical protein
MSVGRSRETKYFRGHLRFGHITRHLESISILRNKAVRQANHGQESEYAPSECHISVRLMKKQRII